MWFDSHCHLHLCAEEADPLSQVVARAKAAGVSQMLAVGIDVASSERALELSDGVEVFASAGLHPNSATEWSDGVRERIDTLLDEERVVAVGETGLDFYRDHASPAVQREAFAAHIERAKGHDKTLVIHTRDSVDAAIDMLRELGPPNRLIFHCWSGDTAQLAGALSLGSYVSFAGNVSFKNAQSIRDAAVDVPADRLLVETDSPYLSPEPYRGKPNEPARVVQVGEALAAARSVPVESLAEQTVANARTVFGLDVRSV